MITGNKAKIQFGIETTYGNAQTPDTQIRISSESFKEKRNKKDEGLLTGAKGESPVITTQINVEGALSTLARPDTVGYFLAAALGVEDAISTQGTNGQEHTFKAIDIDPALHLPSFTILVDRILGVYAYTGCKINSFSFNAQPEDFLKIDVNFIGKEETSGTLQSLTNSVRKPFKFSGGKVKIEGTEIADITSIKFDYNNNLIGNIQTTSTGLYTKEPEVGTRQINFEIETLFSTESLNIYNNYYKSDSNFSIDLIFTSEEEIESGLNYTLTISIPVCQLSDNSFNVGGADVLKHSFSGKAIDNGVDELITIKLLNDKTTKYI